MYNNGKNNSVLPCLITAKLELYKNNPETYAVDTLVSRKFKPASQYSVASRNFAKPQPAE